MQIKKYIQPTAMLFVICMVAAFSCDTLDTPLENQEPEEQIDYTNSSDMILLLHGAYGELNFLQWETFPTTGVRGDDVNSAGDQDVLIETDAYNYDRNFWIYNSTWLNYYNDIFLFNGFISSFQLYKDNGADAALCDQYISEVKVMKAFELLQLTKIWGSAFVTDISMPSELPSEPLSSFDEAMQQISDMMDEAIPNLPAVRPNQRTDIEGGITRYTALAVKAMANLELKNYQIAAEASGEIIESGLFTLYEDYYNLFKIPGKLSDESLLELQYSDFGTGSGTNVRYTWQFFGPQNAAWTPAVDGVEGGWGFWEPTTKYIKFMLDRGEEERLVTSVIFTPDGIAEIESDPDYSSLPEYIGTTTQDGDEFGNSETYNFLSGKHYTPSAQLTPGRTLYGENNNFRIIRYSEILLIYAEAIVSGATPTTSYSADDAVNEVRGRVGMPVVSGVGLDEVLDEKFAELGMEWGIRFYDLVRHERTSELNVGDVTYEPSDRFLPYPLEQLSLLPQLSEE